MLSQTFQPVPVLRVKHSGDTESPTAAPPNKIVNLRDGGGGDDAHLFTNETKSVRCSAMYRKIIKLCIVRDSEKIENANATCEILFSISKSNRGLA